MSMVCTEYSVLNACFLVLQCVQRIITHLGGNSPYRGASIVCIHTSFEFIYTDHYIYQVLAVLMFYFINRVIENITWV